SKMTILPDSDKGQVDLPTGDQTCETPAFRCRIRMSTIDKVELTRVDSIDNSLRQILAEAGRMVFGKTDILIQMEETRFGPINAFLLNKGVQKFELRIPCCGNNINLALFFDPRTNGGRGIAGRRFTELLLVIKNSNLH